MSDCCDRSDFESPSLRARGASGAPAFELKFVVDEQAATEIADWAGRFLQLDPHGVPELFGGYRTTTRYFDTPEADVYHRRGSYRRTKFRLRQYGESGEISGATLLWLERKTKRGDRVVKRRTAIPLAETALLEGVSSERGWTGHWFHRRLLVRRLAPAACVSYARTAFAGVVAEAPVRITIDRHLQGLLLDGWTAGVPRAAASIGVPICPARAIIEFKFLHTLPSLLKEGLYAFGLVPSVFSKYRRCRDLFGSIPASDGRATMGGTDAPGERCA